MVAIVDQALGNILGLNTSGNLCYKRRAVSTLQSGGRVRGQADLQRPQVQDELVRAGAVFAAEQDGVVLLEALRHVVCVQDGKLGGVCQTL